MKTRRTLAAIAALTLPVSLAACEVEDDDTPSTASQPAADDAPATKGGGADNSSKGKGAITWGNWEVVGKIQVKKDALDSFDVVARVRNTGDDSDEGFFTVTILKKQTILGTADCSTSTVQPGSIGLADCVSLDDYKPGWTEITIEDSF